MNCHAVKKLFLLSSILAFSMSAGAQVAAKAPVRAAYTSSRPYDARTSGFNSIDDTATLDFFNGRPVPNNAYRVLFVGDSLTIHEKVPNLWNVWSGMAAAIPAQDFVHLTALYMQNKLGARPVEIFYDNGGNGKLPQMLAYLKNHPELKPSLVILQGGENDPFDASFTTTYIGILDYFYTAKVPMIVLSDFWSAEKKSFEQKEVSERNLPFVDINAIQKNPAMLGDGGPYNVPGVAAHPNSRGMAAIAAAIDTCFKKSVLPNTKDMK